MTMLRMRGMGSRPPLKRTRKGKEPMVEEEAYDATRFLSKPAQDSFYEDLEKKFLFERHITYDRAAHPFLYEQIEARGWNFLLQRPVRDTFPGEIAREFYANAHFANAKKVAWVRGVEVSFTSEAINKFYHIAWPEGQKDETDDLFHRGENEKSDIARMKAFLSNGNEITFAPLRQGQMTQEAKAWALVMCSHLAPTSFNTTYGDERVPLLYALTKGLKFNLGKVIHARLRSTIDRTATHQKSFIFPYLIFGLCKNAGVNFGVTQEVCRLGTKIGNASICATLGLTYQNYAPRPNPPARNFRRALREQEGLAALERKFMVHHEYTSNCINALNDKFDMALRALLGDARDSTPYRGPTFHHVQTFKRGKKSVSRTICILMSKKSLPEMNRISRRRKTTEGCLNIIITKKGRLLYIFHIPVGLNCS